MKISCPGKIIFMGEHAVVYGKSAIAAAVDRRMMATFNEKNQTFEIKSGIPIGCGMGSSAAWSVIQATSKLFFEQSKKFADGSRLSAKILSRINQMTYEYEKINHGYPSGVDNTICTYGGILWYQKIKDKPVFKKLKISHLPEFVLINTGKPIETTKEMVKIVKRKKKKEKIFDEIEKVTNEFLRTLKLKSSLRTERSNLIKESIKTCERCLEELGVVGEIAKKVVREIEQSGGAAKITGAGGLTGGSGMLLCYHENPQQIIDLAKKLNLEAFKIKLGCEGLKIQC